MTLDTIAILMVDKSNLSELVKVAKENRIKTDISVLSCWPGKSGCYSKPFDEWIKDDFTAIKSFESEMLEMMFALK